ncbi:hypothetical protein BJ875DRAFT_468332 [Amylocarpus encephaloides]|uniref:Uncharacterized protein n=1 Tax=Amylocarpus encephaloides TaxID=45428 RepID=A0A9P7YF53_9HELO|nr:hypothetical protein BJ875DRAFT_468332 [Amylocarpus encephaloides]
MRVQPLACRRIGRLLGSGVHASTLDSDFQATACLFKTCVRLQALNRCAWFLTLLCISSLPSFHLFGFLFFGFYESGLSRTDHWYSWFYPHSWDERIPGTTNLAEICLHHLPHLWLFSISELPALKGALHCISGSRLLLRHMVFTAHSFRGRNHLQSNLHHVFNEPSSVSLGIRYSLM